jgi:hypothetical protein
MRFFVNYPTSNSISVKRIAIATLSAMVFCQYSPYELPKVINPVLQVIRQNFLQTLARHTPSMLPGPNIDITLTASRLSCVSLVATLLDIKSSLQNILYSYTSSFFRRSLIVAFLIYGGDLLSLTFNRRRSRWPCWRSCWRRSAHDRR